MDVTLTQNFDAAASRWMSGVKTLAMASTILVLE